jgi:hypothetical protein
MRAVFRSIRATRSQPGKLTTARCWPSLSGASARQAGAVGWAGASAPVASAGGASAGDPASGGAASAAGLDASAPASAPASAAPASVVGTTGTTGSGAGDSADGNRAISPGTAQNGSPCPVRRRTRRTMSPAPVEGAPPNSAASSRELSMTDRSHEPRLAVTVTQPSSLAASRSGRVPTGTML